MPTGEEPTGQDIFQYNFAGTQNVEEYSFDAVPLQETNSNEALMAQDDIEEEASREYELMHEFRTQESVAGETNEYNFMHEVMFPNIGENQASEYNFTHMAMAHERVVNGTNQYGQQTWRATTRWNTMPAINPTFEFVVPETVYHDTEGSDGYFTGNMVNAAEDTELWGNLQARTVWSPSINLEVSKEPNITCSNSLGEACYFEDFVSHAV